jgi:hypothetical protein
MAPRKRNNEAQLKLNLNEPATAPVEKLVVTEYWGTKESCHHCSEEAEWLVEDDKGRHINAWCDEHLPADVRRVLDEQEAAAELEIEKRKTLPDFEGKRYAVRYLEYNGGGPKGFKIVKTETLDKAPAQKNLKADAKRLGAHYAYVYDSQLPEIMAYHSFDGSGVMYCPSDTPGSSISNQPLKVFHLLKKLPREEAKHVIYSHEIAVGHGLRRLHNSPLHNDGLPKKRTCIACQNEFDALHYGQVCCSLDCYMKAAADGLDWLKHPDSPAPKKAPKGFILRDEFDRVWTGVSWCPPEHGTAKVFKTEADTQYEHLRMTKGCKFTVEKLSAPKSGKPEPKKQLPPHQACLRCGEDVTGAGPSNGHCKQCAAVIELEAEKAKLKAPPNKCTACGGDYWGDRVWGAYCSAVCAENAPAEGEKSCPGCGKTGNIDTDFGWRSMPRKNGVKRVPQSRCKKCR